MLSIFSRRGFTNILFFATAWVFFSLNVTLWFKVPHADIVRWVLLGALIVVVLLSGKAKEIKPPLIIPFFIVATLPSVFFSLDKKESLLMMLSFVVVVWGFSIVLSSYESREEMELLFKMIMLITIVYEIASVVALIAGKGYHGTGDRAYGITGNPNSLGVYSNLAFLSAGFLFLKDRGFKRLIFFTIMVVSVYTTVLSQSRTAFVTITMNIVVVLILSFKSNTMRAITIAFGLLFGVLLYGGFLNFLDLPVLDRINAEGGKTRDEIWPLAISVWKQFPVFGCGYRVSKFFNPVEDGFMDFHNSYLSILVEVGIWGCGLLLIPIINTVKSFFKIVRVHMKTERITLFMLCCLMLIELAVAAYSESFLFAVGSPEGAIFWMLFTWGLVYQNKHNESV